VVVAEEDKKDPPGAIMDNDDADAATIPAVEVVEDESQLLLLLEL
jgi:hypothetical protein